MSTDGSILVEVEALGPFQSEEEATEMFYYHITSRADQTDHSIAHQKKNEPVFQKDDGSWLFYDETWIYACGPYESEEEAQGMLQYYIQVEFRRE